MVYFDNAATSLPKPLSVKQAMLESLDLFGGAGRGGHPAALNAARRIFLARSALADLLGSAPERTVFTANATESLNTAITGLLKPSDHVITTAFEHNSVLRPLYRLHTRGMGLSIIDADARGNLDYEGFRKNLQSDTKAVVCTHASNLIGTFVDLEYISDFCRQHNLLFIVDAAQTAGVFPIAADRLGIDVLCFTGHKGLLGPQGTGGMCVRKSLEIMPLKVGGSGTHSYSKAHPADMPEALEAGTLNAHGIAGLLAGVEYIQETGIESIRNHELSLAKMFREGVSAVPGVCVYGNPNQPCAPIVTLNIGDIDSSVIGDRLASRYEICVRTGAHCSPLTHIALGTQEQGAVRFSFSSFNTEEEIQFGIKALAEIACELEGGENGAR